MRRGAVLRVLSPGWAMRCRISSGVWAGKAVGAAGATYSSYVREANGEWTRDEIHGEGEILIPVLETTLTMDDVYDDVALPPLAVEEEYEWADYAGEDGADRL